MSITPYAGNTQFAEEQYCAYLSGVISDAKRRAAGQNEAEAQAARITIDEAVQAYVLHVTWIARDRAFGICYL
jgi:hypothetical protein